MNRISVCTGGKPTCRYRYLYVYKVIRIALEWCAAHACTEHDVSLGLQVASSHSNIGQSPPEATL